MSKPSNFPRLDESLLEPLPPFSRLKREAIREILDAARSAHIPAGETVFHEAAPADRFFLLLDGTVRVIRLTESGEQVISLHIPAGQLFGIAHALGRDTYPATAVAASDLVVLSWPSTLWDGFSKTHDGFATQTYKTGGRPSW